MDYRLLLIAFLTALGVAIFGFFKKYAPRNLAYAAVGTGIVFGVLAWSDAPIPADGFRILLAALGGMLLAVGFERERLRASAGRSSRAPAPPGEGGAP